MPVTGSEVCGIGVVVVLPKRYLKYNTAIGCVRYLADPTKTDGPSLEENDIAITCSCIQMQIEGYCVHSEYCKHALTLVHSILALPVPAYRTETMKEWQCYLVGRLDGVISAICVVVRYSIGSTDEASFIPVMESRDQKQMYMNLSRWL